MARESAEFRFTDPVFCLTPQNLSRQLQDWGEVIRPTLDAKGFFEISLESARRKTVQVAVLEPAIRLLETLIGVSSLFKRKPSIMTNAEDLGAYEVILRGYRGEEQVFFAHSTRFKSEIFVPANFEMTVFYMCQEQYPAVRAMLEILLAGRSLPACCRLTNGACGARYWDPHKGYKIISASKVLGTKLEGIAEHMVSV